MQSIRFSMLRRIHRWLAPIMVMPLLITLVSGTLFQLAAINGQEETYLWLLELHRGRFGRINLELIYPFLNALGLLILLASGLLMWLRTPIHKSHS